MFREILCKKNEINSETINKTLLENPKDKFFFEKIELLFTKGLLEKIAILHLMSPEKSYIVNRLFNLLV